MKYISTNVMCLDKFVKFLLTDFASFCKFVLYVIVCITFIEIKLSFSFYLVIGMWKCKEKHVLGVEHHVKKKFQVELLIKFIFSYLSYKHNTFE